MDLRQPVRRRGVARRPVRPIRCWRASVPARQRAACSGSAGSAHRTIDRTRFDNTRRGDLRWGWTTSRCTGRAPASFYDPVAPAEFVDFGEIAEMPPASPRRPPPWPCTIAKTGTVRATAYTELVDLLLGLEDVLYATDAAAEDEDPVIDPDGCAWIAGGLERFVDGHRAARRDRSPSTRSARCCAPRSPTAASPSSSCAGSTRGWHALRDDAGNPPQLELRPHRAQRPGRLLPPLRRLAASPSTPADRPRNPPRAGCGGPGGSGQPYVSRGPRPRTRRGPRDQDGAAGPWMLSLVTTLWPTSPAICCSRAAAEQPQLGGPGGRLRLDGQHAVLQLHRAAVRGDLRADHPLPGAEDRRLGRRLLPAPGLDEAGQHGTEQLRVARVRSRPGVAAQPALTALAATARRTPSRCGCLAACLGRVQHRPGQLRPRLVPVGSRPGCGSSGLG